ncbi:MAG: two-component regulator propeller domain-containing protein, partial [Bacteroidota bacterium]
MRLLHVIAVFFSIQWIGAQTQLNFDKVVTSDFETSWVSNIIQDTYGYIWIGTQDGLYRYDGYEMLAFRNKPYDANSLPGNWVRYIDNSNKDQLWMAVYGGGLSRLHLKELQFYNHENTANCGYFLKQVVATPNNELFIISEDLGILYAKPDTDTIKKIGWGSSTSQMANSGDEFYVTEGDMVFKFDFQTETLIPLIKTFSADILSIKAISKNKLLLGTEDGLFSMNVETGEMNSIYKRSAVTLISNEFNGQVYFGGGHTLYRCSLNPEGSFEIQPIDTPEGSLTSLFIDTDGYLWMGTEKGLWKERTRFSGLINPNLPFHARRILKKDEVVYLLGKDGLIRKPIKEPYERLFEDQWFTGGNIINNEIWLGNYNGEVLVIDLL